MLRNIFITVLCAVCALSVPSSGLKAQEVDSLAVLLDEVVTVADGYGDTLSSGSARVSMQSFDGKDIRRLGLRGLSEAVKRMSGVDLHDYGGVGGLKTVSVRGLGAKHTAVAYDGVVVSDAQSGMVDLGRFTLENVSDVSLALGVADVASLPTAREYASASLLSLSLLAPYEGLHSDVKVQCGSFGLTSLSAYGGYGWGGSSSLSFSGHYLRSDGMYPFDLVNGKITSREKRRDGDVESMQFEGNLRVGVSGGSLNAKIHYFGSERGLPGAVNLYNKNNRERLWNRNAFAQVDYLFPDSWPLGVRLRMKYDHNYSRYREVNANYASGEQVDRNVQNEYYLSLALGKGVGRGFACSAASDVSYATLDNNFENSKAPRRLSSYTVIAAGYEGEALSVSLSLLASYIKDVVRTGTVSGPYRRFSPALSLLYRLSPSFSLRASYKDAYRVPTFADLYYLRLGNVTLKPERATMYNVGLVLGGRCGSFADDVTVSADVYYNNVRDKIVALPTMYIWRMVNCGKSDIYGASIDVSARKTLVSGLCLRVDANYSWQRALDVTDKAAKNYRHQLPYTPEHSGNFSLSFENPVVNVAYMLSFVGERYMLPQNKEANRMPGYAEHSFSLNREFRLGGGARLRLQSELLNVGNEQYEVIRYYPMPGFSWRLSACVGF